MRIRVLRVLEYTYDSVERAEEDMQHWVVQGARRFHSGELVKSVVFPLETLPDEES